MIGEFDRANDLKWRLGQAAPCQLDKSSRGLYWIGNLCIDGERAKGNFPRSPLVIARLQEEPFGLVRDSFTVIDRRAPHEDPRVQHSNFRMYQDRANGDVVLFLTRYGERGHDGKNWLRADQYEYRVAIE